MQQHPIPQNVTSYEFRLIGDMTLKQFLQLLSGGVPAYVFYSTNLPDFIKWPLVAFSVMLGAAFAFLPLEGRPLEKWMMAFIRAIYKPTQFHWKKTPKLPSFLLNQDLRISPPSPTTSTQTTRQESVAKKKKGLADLLHSSPKTTSLAQEVDSRVQEINQLFTAPTKTDASLKTPPPPSLQKKSPEVVFQQPEKIIKKTPSQAPNASIEVKPVKNIQIAKPGSKKPNQPTIQSTNIPTSQPQPTQGEVVIKPKKDKPKVSAFFNPKLPFPSLPEKPNTLVGMVYTQAGIIVENAIIEIQNNQKHTVRATKTNKIGQFFLATPLPEGSYFISMEKPGLSFQTISIKLENKIYPPLEIRATN